jgi:sec-independent protein translocase protein TatC
MATLTGSLGFERVAPRENVRQAKTDFWRPLLLGIPLLGEMPFLDHLEELRRRLIRALIAVAIGMGIAFMYAADIIRLLKKPASDLGIILVANGSTEIFQLFFNVTLAGGICLASPVILWQTWRFIEPALYPHEKRYAGPFILSTTVCFAAGGVFGYAIVTPYIFHLQKGLADLVGIEFRPTALGYVGLLTATVVAMGIIFEMPPVVFVMSRIGLINARFLLRHFKHALLLFGIAAAILTPSGDATPMLAFMGVMIALYAVSIVTAALFGKSRTSPIASA